VLSIAAPLNKFTRVDAEGIGQLPHRGHMGLGFVALGSGDGGLGKPGTFSQLRLG
jgi:hypothetical protein